MDNVCLVKLYNKGTQPAVEPKEESMLLCASYSFVDVAHSILPCIALCYFGLPLIEPGSEAEWF